MTLQIELCPYGEPAFEQLHRLIDDIKDEDPFALATVVVSQGPIGLGVRRGLASLVSARGRRGVTNVSFSTLSRLADTLAGAAMVEEGRLPLTDAVLRAAIRSALAAEPESQLGRTRDHPSTVDALVATYREMRTVDAAALDALASASARATEVMAVLGEARQRTALWFDEVDVLEAAVGQVQVMGTSVLALTGPVVLYLPTALAPPAARLVRALAEVVPCTAILGVTGDESADEVTRQLLTALQPGREAAWPDNVVVAAGDAVLSAPSADAELLLVVRDLMQRCEDGTSLERMAIAYGGSSQYVTLLHNMLRQAGIPFNGGGIRPLSSTVAGRTLLGALTLPEHDWRREEAAAWLTTGPLVHAGVPVPHAQWDVLSSEAGVTNGLTEWGEHLAKLAAARRARAAEDDVEDDGAWQRSLLADARQCEALLTFVTGVSNWLGEGASTWPAWARWAKSLLHRLVGGSKAIEEWPTEERAAATAVEEAIDRLGVLEQLGATFSPGSAKAALVAELADPAPQTSRFGSGVWVAPIGSLIGHRLDVLYVVGMNDGIFPSLPADDVLIPDREREGVSGPGAIPLRGTRAVTMHRAYLGALAGARLRLLSFSRGNQRDGREMRPSRWLLDSLGTVLDSPGRLYSNDLENLRPTDSYRVEPSFMASVASPDGTMSLEDRDLRSLLSWTALGRPIADHFLCRDDPELTRGVELAEGRRSGFTRFDGNVAALAIDQDLVPPLLSATRLEAYAGCPRHYFFESVLRVLPRPTDVKLLATDRMDRGKLVHRILERFVEPQLGVRVSDDPEGLFDVERLMAIAQKEMETFAADGFSGPRTAWRVEQIQIRRELRAFAAVDRQWRIDNDIQTTGVEQKFGSEGVEPVAVDVPGRQPVRFRGTIDRVDVTPDRGRIVTDYKTGGADWYKGIEGDHFQGGRSLQLAIYALAVGEDGQKPVRTEYWFVSEKGGFARRGYELTSEEAEEFTKVIDVLSASMARGQFPANPGGGMNQKFDPCAYCPYDSVCPKDRDQIWERTKGDPILSRYVALAES